MVPASETQTVAQPIVNKHDLSQEDLSFSGSPACASGAEAGKEPSKDHLMQEIRDVNPRCASSGRFMTHPSVDGFLQDGGMVTENHTDTEGAAEYKTNMNQDDDCID